MSTIIREIRAGDWEQVRRMRLDALLDPAAAVAFLETHEQAAAKPDEFWRTRAANASEGAASARQFVAETEDGRWLGTITAIVELPGGDGAIEGDVIEAPQIHLVGVYVRPEARGAGLLQELVGAASAWAWSLSEPEIGRVRLFVHEDNTRAEAAYVKAGFAVTGLRLPVPGDATRQEVEMEVLRG
ncbi:GNAT family N-acetyltransferase [Kitasatospora sp. NPDC051170]|uniref:GNAT family N-acetyltransferase n=1 Tax=Kitasatospora sp. NPDC051170 TaxID=3364056 RepID=UPI003796BC83